MYDNPVFKIYINGKLEYTNSGVSNSSSFAYATALIHDSQYHYLADVRIYDNTLSPKEVHEISLGLCCHYPLNDPYATGSINKYSGDNFEGKPSGSSYTVTKLANERGYNYKLSYTGTGNNTWPNFTSLLLVLLLARHMITVARCGATARTLTLALERHTSVMTGLRA